MLNKAWAWKGDLTLPTRLPAVRGESGEDATIRDLRQRRVPEQVAERARVAVSRAAIPSRNGRAGEGHAGRDKVGLGGVLWDDGSVAQSRGQGHLT